VKAVKKNAPTFVERKKRNSRQVLGPDFACRSHPHAGCMPRPSNLRCLDNTNNIHSKHFVVDNGTSESLISKIFPPDALHRLSHCCSVQIRDRGQGTGKFGAHSPKTSCKFAFLVIIKIKVKSYPRNRPWRPIGL
jgi:hypothetical protein